VNKRKSSGILRNSATVIVVQFTGIIVKFFSNIILAWFLTPHDFGVAAIVTTVFMALTLLSDVGIGDNIVRHVDGEKRDFQQACFNIQVLRGLVLYGILLLISGPLATLYGEDIIQPCLQVGGVSLLIDALLSTGFYRMMRNHEVAKLVLMDLSAQVLSAIVVIAYAYFSPTVWALVLGHIVTALVKTVGSHWLAPMDFSHYRWRSNRYQQILGFGKWIFFITLFHFVITQSDKLIYGKLVTTSELGVYAISAALTAITMMLSYNFSLRILYPVLSEAARGSGEDYADKIHETMKHILPALLVFCLLTFAFAPPFFTYLYKTDYAAAGHITQYLALATWFTILYDLYQKVPVSYGLPQYTAMISFATAASRIVLSIIGFRVLGTEGFILGLALGAMIGVGLIQLWMMQRDIRPDTYEVRLSILFVAIFVGQLALKNGLETRWFNELFALALALFTAGFAFFAYREPIRNQYAKLRQRAG